MSYEAIERQEAYESRYEQLLDNLATGKPVNNGELTRIAALLEKPHDELDRDLAVANETAFNARLARFQATPLVSMADRYRERNAAAAKPADVRETPAAMRLRKRLDYERIQSQQPAPEPLDQLFWEEVPVLQIAKMKKMHLEHVLEAKAVFDAEREKNRIEREALAKR